MSTTILQGILVFILSSAGVSIASWVYLSEKKSKQHFYLALLVVTSILFMAFDYLAVFVNHDFSTVFERLVYLFGTVSVAIFYVFSRYFPQKSERRLIVKIPVFIYATIFSTLILFTNLVIANVSIGDFGVEVVGGSLNQLYNLISIVMVALVVYAIVKKYFESSRVDKTKIQLFVFGSLVFIFAELVFSVLLPIFGLTHLSFIGDYFIIVFLSFAAYSIVKHHLFDVRLAIVRSVTYALLVGTLAGIYTSVTFAISSVFNLGQVSSPAQIAVNVATSLLLLFLFQPLKKFFDRVTNRIFYKDNYHVADFIARLNKMLTQTTDLRSLLQRVSYEIGTTLKAEQAFFFVFTKPDGRYLSAGTDGHTQMPLRDAILIEGKSQGISKVIQASTLDDGDSIKRTMISHKIELILPLIQDADVVGFLCMGDHRNSGYTKRDITALNTISNELLIAIQNAAAVHEIREINAGLQQKIANATKELRSKNAILLQLDKIKDEFIGMASHQLRTPLTSVKGYLSMVIEGDAGKITSSQKQLLDQAFMSSENMVHLINDFLNVSRIQAGKFIIDKSPVDLSLLVEQEVNSLRPNAEVRGMKFEYKKPKNFPIIDLDDGKTRQVVMNFADNAIYYSHDNSKIIISLSVEGNEAVFTVKDTGIGVPAKEKEHLFSKFYRASNAKVQRPDGTGVGIFLAKRVISEQGGEIIFESVEGKGSTFGFRIPIK